jgi:hypothetical protein
MSDEQKSDGTPEEFVPTLDFSSIVFPFYTQALVKLGLLEDPLKGKVEGNMEFAKRLIDLLDLLKERTKGNLTSEENQFLESCLVQLKLNYMEKAKILKI